MKKGKRGKGLVDKDKFSVLEEEKKAWLKNLSLKKAIELEERLLSSSFIWIWRKNFFADNPVCLKDSLRRKS